MKKILLSLTLLGTIMPAFSQNKNFWKSVSQRNISDKVFATHPKPEAYKLFNLQEAFFKNDVVNIPSEKVVSATRSSFIISIPNPEGQIETFKAVEAPVMDPVLAAKYPGIKSYAGVGIDDPTASVRFDVSPRGFHGMITSASRPTFYIDPLDNDNQLYIVFSREHALNLQKHFNCGTDVDPKTAGGLQKIYANRLAADDGKLRTYRLALASTGEYSQYFLNGSESTDTERKGKVLAAMNTLLTRTNQVYERDFGIRMVLIGNNDAIIYLNPSTDPWTTEWNKKTQQTIDAVIGDANYDIGHLVHKEATAADNNGNAGCIACVCKTGSKGSGFTSHVNPEGDPFVIDYTTHEMGHQFGANHTFTFRSEGTTVQMEPGSGSTIMGYAGITGSTTDVQPHSDDYFHTKSIEQISNYIKSSTGAACAVVTLTGNTPPAVNAGSNYTIPKSTPFTLTGTATDADASDGLQSCWEQIDNWSTSGASTVPSSTSTKGPAFRTYNYVPGASRTVPKLSYILSGANGYKWEVLPSVARTLNFRFTARDNHSGGGNNNTADMIVTVSTAGPFAVTAPNTILTWSIGSTQTVTWSVNSTNLAPVSCTSVKISLSTDGGQTFPIVLNESTPNDGSESITVPNVTSATCRIKVEAVGNIFFDICNANFSINSNTTPATCGTVTGLSSSAIATNSATVSWTALDGAVSYDVDYKISSSTTWTNAATATTSTSKTITGLTPSTAYDWRVRATCSGAIGAYANGSFTTSATTTTSCPSTYDNSTNGSISGAATIPFNINVTGLVNNSTDKDHYKFVITNAGTITITLTNLPADYDLSLLNSKGRKLKGSQASGTASETITYSATAGTYYVQVYGYNGAYNSTACYTTKVQLGTASRSEVVPEAIVKMSPNPASTFLNVSVPYLSAKSVLQIIDATGKVAIQKNITKNIEQVNISALAKGFYVMRIYDGKNSSTYKFIKQ